MAGTIIADFIRADANKFSINVGNTIIASVNALGILSNTGNVMISSSGQVPNTVISGTITQSQIGTNVSGTGPAFNALAPSGSTVTSGVNTKCVLSTERFDTNSRFNNTGSTVNGIPAYAFLPDVAGYYQVNLTVSGNGSSSTGRVFAWIYKNGSADYGASTAPQGNTNTGCACISVLIYMNGTTDYLEAYGNVEGTGTLTMNGSTANSFSASLVRAA